MGTGLHFNKMKRILETDGGDDCTAMGVYLRPQNCRGI